MKKVVNESIHSWYVLIHIDLVFKGNSYAHNVSIHMKNESIHLVNESTPSWLKSNLSEPWLPMPSMY